MVWLTVQSRELGVPLDIGLHQVVVHAVGGVHLGKLRPCCIPLVRADLLPHVLNPIVDRMGWSDGAIRRHFRDLQKKLVSGEDRRQTPSSLHQPT